MKDPRDSAAILAEEILSNIELADIALAAIMLKCARLARLIGDNESRQLFSFEAGGYPSTADGVPEDAFEAGRRAGRVYQEKDKDGILSERMSTASVQALEQAIESNKISLSAAVDPDISVSSANPNQVVWSPIGNSQERARLAGAIANGSKILAKSRAYAYQYALNVHYELAFASAASNIFDIAALRRTLVC